MADSNITKRAMANSLKALLSERDYKKISISDICDRCGMNRKSFYYHFRDKYDLVNWIFDFETDSLLKADGNTLSREEMLLGICTYFYSNKDFYRKAFNIEGQNSFSSHFYEALRPIILDFIKESSSDCAELKLQSDILARFLLISVKSWLSEKEIKSPECFVKCLKSLFVKQ